MAAQVEVQPGEVGRPVAGGRLHLNPLTDSSNKSLIEIPSINQSHIITAEPNKPAPAPRPRLSPKPFTVDRNPSIKPILAPKPQTRPRPESTRLPGYKPEPPCNPKPQQPAAPVKLKPVLENSNRPAPTSFKTANKVNTGQTTKPVVQPFKPAPPFEPGDPAKPTIPGASRLGYSRSLKQNPAAEWSGTTKTEEERDNTTSSKGGASITRAKSMGFLAQVGQEQEVREEAKPEVVVPLRPKPRGSRPRPVSAIFLDSPTKLEAQDLVPRWVGRRPLSADLTSKFESIGLSLHRKGLISDTKENTPEETALPQKKEQEKTPKSNIPQSNDSVAKPVISDQSNKMAEEVSVKETDENKRRVSIKSRISLLLDSSSTPATGANGQGSDLHSPVQLVPEIEPPVGVKKLIKQLTLDTPPTQSPVTKQPLKPRPLPLDLTKRFSSERSPDLGSEAADHHEVIRDPQRRNEEFTPEPSDHMTFGDFKDSQEELTNVSMPERPEAGQTLDASSKESGPSGEVQTVRASLFENVVERHSVLMVDEGEPANKLKESLSSLSLKRESAEDEGTLVTANYKEQVSPSSPLRVVHAYDKVQAIEENRAVSENIPAAQWEDKAMTLRSRRSEGSRPAAERTGPAQAEPTLSVTPDQQPRFLRVGALPKWTTTGLEQDAGTEREMQNESQREGEVALDKERRRDAEQEEVAAAPKRLKILQAEEQQKPRATYFALTGQMQEPVTPEDARANMGDIAMPLDDFSVRSALGGSQAKILPVRRNPSLEEAFGRTSQDQVEELMRSHMPHREIRPALDGQGTEEIMFGQKQDTEKHKGKIKELEREKQRQLELEKQAHLEFARMKEREMQREFERQRQKAFEKEKKEFLKKQRALERQNQIELEKQQLQELERERQRELERERQRQLDKEKRRELEREREREIEREKQREQERERQREQERQRQREEERQRELDKERQLLEIQKEKQKMEELERQQLLEFQKQRQKEKERQQLIELEKQRLREKMEREEAEKRKQMALEQEMLRLRELEKEREKQRELENERQKAMERERDKQRELERRRQLDIERQELENQRFRQRELERERQREELDRLLEMEKKKLIEFEKQKQAERDRQQTLEFEKSRLREKMEREEAEKMRQIAKLQEAERQRLKEKQRKEEQERVRSEPLRPKVLDLDSVQRNEQFSKPASHRSDLATRWKEPSARVEESYNPYDTFTSQTQPSSNKDLFPVPALQGVDDGVGWRLQPTPERDVSWKVPPQTSGGFSSPVWTASPQDPWELRPVEMSVDKPVAEPRKHSNILSPEQLLLRQEERLLTPQRHRSALVDEPQYLGPVPGTDTKAGSSAGGVNNSSAPENQIWLPTERQPQDSRGEVWSQKKSQESKELNRMRSRSVSRRSAPSFSTVEGSLSRMRSRSSHREQDRHSWVQQKQGVTGEEEENDQETPVHETDSQYGTWETGLRTDDSLTPATPSSESNFSPSQRKPTTPHTPGDLASKFEIDTLDGLLPQSSSDNQPLSFPDAPTTLLDTSVLRSRAQLQKKRAPRTRPTKTTRQTAAQTEGDTAEDWLYKDSTEAKVERKEDDSNYEEQKRRVDLSPAATSQPQRVALFPGMDPSALKAQLKKRSDFDNQTEAPAPSPSQLSRSPKSPFLPRAARVLPPAGGKENGEDSPQWLKELKTKKRLSQYENES
ncbi:calponin homology domain-containing protein DDB_G0272472 [Limanda limanda]|uniref:calponin homology domain-containing protein DDB_G0272472 n=1 Tax=Limanda limanda TaxID=27771 RepID=UPI0029C8B54E|nr:calponin homology domain-containing protein DDB_G0272472 [Limanda limanda]